jgi:gliding motility-associated-like protein
MNGRRTTYFIVFVLLYSHATPQKEGFNWFFGQKAGLMFHEGYPQAISGAMETIEGCATISTALGDLLFYTDGVTVYNRKHLVMQNGYDLNGNFSATQSGVIVPMPGDTTTYFIFTVNNLDKKKFGAGLCYSIVDMSLDNGLGAVTEKNIQVMSSSTERVTSVRHANESSFWVVAHEWESSRFKSFLITNNGVEIAYPVVSDVGLYQGGVFQTGKGYMKISPDGQRLAVAIQGESLIQIFDFDDATGIISNPFDLILNDQPYGIEFSRGAQFLYASERYGPRILQWDLNAGSYEEIVSSRTTIGILSEPNSLGGALQMAPDGKIYMAVKQKKYLSAINKPSQSGTACSFNEKAVFLNVNDLCQWGLPTFVQSFFNYLWIEHENQCTGDTIFFRLNHTENIDSVYWNFDNPESGATNYAYDLDTWHIYDQPGNYEIKVIAYYGIFTDTLTHVLKIFPMTHVDLGADRVICQGDSVILKPAGEFTTWEWMDEPGFYDSVLIVKESGQYWIATHNVCGSNRDTVSVFIQPLPVIELGNDTLLRIGTTILLEPGSGYASYLWQDGGQSEFFTVYEPGYFYVEVTDEIGCKSTDEITIHPEPITAHIPTAFSPNRDGVNDLYCPFFPYDFEYSYEFYIFNRFGQTVFEANSITDCWDGTFVGEDCPVEVYTWFIRITSQTYNPFLPEPILLKGNVTLLR